jgi:hypothetical protein
MTMVLMLVAGMLLLGAGLSGFVSDAEVSATRLGSDFEDARYQQFNEFSVERAQQRSRRQQIGMEAVAGAGLMVLGMVFFTPKRKARVYPKQMETPAPPVAAPRKQPALLPAEVIQERYASRRRRPNSSLHIEPLRAGKIA